MAELPPVVVTTPDYDPGNPDHVRRWELAGRPDLKALDGDGNYWCPWVEMRLQEDGESYLPVLAPTPNPVTDVERVAGALQPKLDTRESQRRANVAQVRALAAAAMMLADWQLPADLAESVTAAQLAGLVGAGQLAPTVAYLTTGLGILAGDATEEEQQKRSVQYVRVMTEGARFGLVHSEGLTAYERTASLVVVASIASEEASAGWRALPCEGYADIGAIFPAILR